MKYFLPAVFLAAFLGIFFGLSKTQSFLSDEEKASNNILSTATTFDNVTPTPTIEPTPTEIPTPTPTSGPPIADHLVINEVYYDVDASHGGNEGNAANPDEWIELYNPTSNPVNLKNWKIIDNSGTERSISESNVDIPAGGFAVLAKSASTFTHWSIPASVEKIAIGQRFGDGLSNDGDRAILKDNNGVIIDQMSYGTDMTIFSPAAPDVSEGHSLERDPDGVDTNTAADFVDRTTPTPGS